MTRQLAQPTSCLFCPLLCVSGNLCYYQQAVTALACTVAGQSIEPEVYPRPDGSVYICGVPEHVELPADPNSIQANPGSIEDLKEVARSVSTRLADAPLEVGQSCYLPVSEDGIPVVGEVPGVQGAYIASGTLG